MCRCVITERVLLADGRPIFCIFGRPPLAAFRKCSHTVQLLTMCGLQEKTSTEGMYSPFASLALLVLASLSWIQWYKRSFISYCNTPSNTSCIMLVTIAPLQRSKYFNRVRADFEFITLIFDCDYSSEEPVFKLCCFTSTLVLPLTADHSRLTADHSHHLLLKLFIGYERVLVKLVHNNTFS